MPPRVFALSQRCPAAAVSPGEHTGGRRILVPMSKRTVVAGVVWVVLSALAFAKDPILGSVVLIFGACIVVVVQLASSWDDHPDYEAREKVRAQRRQAKWHRNAGSREKDAARYAAHQARQAAKGGTTDRTRSTDRLATGGTGEDRTGADTTS